jgi:GNAT superfamily N-acetyltransferase
VFIILEIKIADIEFHINLNDFTCENNSINNYLKQNAYFEHIMKQKNIKLIYIKNKLIGFYALEYHEITLDEEDFKNYRFPCVKLSYLAIDKDSMNQGIGSKILDYINESILQIAKIVPCSGIYIDSLLEKQEWYYNRGFQYIENSGNSETTVSMFLDYRNIEQIYSYFDE